MSLEASRSVTNSNSKIHYLLFREGCFFVTKSKSTMAEHQKNVHPDGSETLVCDMCGLDGLSKRQLQVF